jgi:hypothetical protein
MIESRVDHQILAKCAGNHPEVTDGVAMLEWLREMPYLAAKSELSDGTRDRQGLAELRSTCSALHLFCNDPVRIDVKSVQIFTENNRCRLSKSAIARRACPWEKTTMASTIRFLAFSIFLLRHAT